MKRIDLAPNIFIIDNFLSPTECKSLVEKSEKHGFEEAEVTVDGASKMIKGIRNNQRVIFKDIDLASTFWNKIKSLITETFDESSAFGLNEQFRFYKYENAQKFNRHIDGRYKRNELEESRLTLLIYLNDNFDGGETEFDDVTVTPKTGTALVFLHEIKHKGCPVTSGIKYALRTDIMFRNNQDQQ